MSTTRLLRLVLLLTALALALPPEAARAAMRRWTPFGPPWGGVLDMVADPSTSGLLYAVMDPGQVFRSSDGGGSWAWSGTGMTSSVYALTPDPRQPGRLWAAGPAAVFRSDDRGAHWSRVTGPSFPSPSPPLGPQILLAAIPGQHPADPAILLFRGLAAGPLLRSTDGGRTWSVPFDPGQFWLLKTDVRGRIYASILGGGLWRSDDAGLTWKQLGAVAGDVDDLAAAPAQPRIVYALTMSAVVRSGNGGATWTTVLNAPERSWLTALAVDPLEPGTVYAAIAEDSIIGAIPSARVSRDSGASWRETARYAVGGVILRLTVEPARRIAYAVGHTDLVASPDYGSTWRHEIVSAAGALSLGARDQLRFDPRDPRRIFAVAGGNLFTSADAGRTWRAPSSQAGELNDVAFDPVRHGFLYGIFSNGIRLTKDGGATWSAYSPSPGGGLTMAFLTSRTAVAAGEGLLRSTDRGRTWTRAVSGNPQGLIYRLCDRLTVDPANAQHVFAGCFLFDFTGAQIRYLYREMWQSRDGALSWTLDLTLEDVAFDPGHPGTVYGLSTSATPLRSRDGGDSWEPAGDLGSTGVISIVVDPLGGRAVYALLRTGRVEASRDGGDTWSLLGGAGTPLLASYDGFWAHPTRPGQLYCAAEAAYFEASFPEE